MSNPLKITGYIGICEYETKNWLDITGRQSTPLYVRKKDLIKYIEFMNYSLKYKIHKIELNKDATSKRL